MIMLSERSDWKDQTDGPVSAGLLHWKLRDESYKSIKA